MEDQYLQIEADMLSRATRRVIESGDYVDVDCVVSMTGCDLTQLAGWEQARALFSIKSDGKTLYPRFALDAGPAAAPRQAVANIMQIFGKKDGWRLAFWFASVNGYLDGMRPQDVLQTDPQKVIEAAQRQVEAVQNG